MKLEVGKFYKARDGRKVGPLRASDEMHDRPFEFDGILYRHDGTYHFYRDKRGSDLISEWPTETGTLAELNVKPGDVVENQHGYQYTISINEDGKYCDVDDMAELDPEPDYWRIISRADQAEASPVRTVTRTSVEIVPGEYGLVVIEDGAVRMGCWIPVEDDIEVLSDAITTLTQIRDALRD